MTIQLTREGLREIFPKAPEAIINAYLDEQDVLAASGVNHTRQRLAYTLAQVDHETKGLTMLTESIAYSPERAVQVWPSRFKSVSDLYAKIGSRAGDPDFRRKLMNSVYGGRMGNRPRTNDGFDFIGRGPMMVTGRSGYQAVENRIGTAITRTPVLAASAALAPDITAAVVAWKGLNAKADVGDFTGHTKLLNGGTIGLADRKARLARITAVVARLPGAPPTAKPPQDVIDTATAKERVARTGGAAAATGGTLNEAGKATGAADQAVLVPSVAAWTLIGVGIAVAIVAAVLIVRKRRAVEANWN